MTFNKFFKLIDVMNTIDLIVIVIYVLGCTALGAWLGRQSQGLKGYFLAESDIPAWAVMISIVATETSTATFLSVPGVAYTKDFTFLQLAFGYIVGRVIVATVILPAYFRGQILTAYQLLQDRFGGPTRTTASVPSCLHVHSVTAFAFSSQQPFFSISLVRQRKSRS